MIGHTGGIAIGWTMSVLLGLGSSASAQDAPRQSDLGASEFQHLRFGDRHSFFKRDLYANDTIKLALHAFKADDAAVRLMAAKTLFRVGNDARFASNELPAIFVKEHDHEIRRYIIWSLGNIGAEAKDSVSLLADALDDPATRYAAIGALGKIGKNAASAAPRLHQLVQDDADYAIRIAAAQALLRIDPKDDKAKSLLSNCLLNPKWRDGYGVLAAEALMRTTSASEAIQFLSDEMLDRNNSAASAEILAQYDTPEVDAAFEAALKHSSQVVRQNAASARMAQMAVDVWRPPSYSSIAEVPRELVGADDTSLQDIHDKKLIDALQNRGYLTWAVFVIPGGFAMLTGPERITAAGASETTHRFIDGYPPLEGFSPFEWRRRLVSAHRGYHRVFVIAITKPEIKGAGEDVTFEQIVKWRRDESGDLRLRNHEKVFFKDRNCYVLVYHFQTLEGGKYRYLHEGDLGWLSAKVHLKASGLWAELGGGR